jgi:hypothetical protein
LFIANTHTFTKTATKFRKSISEALESDWQKRKQKLREETAFGAGKPSKVKTKKRKKIKKNWLLADTLSLSHKMLRESYAASPQQWMGRRGPTTMSNKMLRYAQIIAKLNEERASRRPFPLVDAFMKVSEVVDEREMVSCSLVVVSSFTVDLLPVLCREKWKSLTVGAFCDR